MTKKKATIYRITTPDHLCPWGIKALDLLKRNGYEIEDNHLESDKANEAYKEENGVDETPQILIEGVPLGFISLTENLMMMTMAVWMMVHAASASPP